MFFSSMSVGYYVSLIDLTPTLYSASIREILPVAANLHFGLWA